MYTLNPNLRTLVLSSSRYTSIQACYYRAFLRYVKKIYPLRKVEPLERGTLIDTLCNEYYKARKDGITITEALNDAIDVARQSAIKMDIPIAKVEFILERFVQYVHHYMNDDWKVKAVQAPFTKIIYQNEAENLQIIAEGILDLIVETRMGILVVDTKSTAREADWKKIQVRKMDNQFKMYCTVLGVNQICINEIGVQKSKNEDALFKREIINLSNAILTEWLEEVVYWANSWLDHVEAGLFPKNTSSCYGCDYTTICSEQPEMRLAIINRDFKEVKEDFNIYDKKEEEKVINE